MKPPADRWLRAYPPRWRHRYGDELLAMVEDLNGGSGPGRWMRWSLVMSGLRERARESWIVGGGATGPERIRGGAALVVAGWAVTLPAGFSFVKVTEHWQPSTPSGSHLIPSVAIAVVALAAAVGGVIVLGAAAVALPELVARLRAGAWRRLRVPAASTALLSAAWLGLSVAGVLRAHQLTAAQRNAGAAGYGSLFYAWGSLTVVTIAAWALLAVRCERELEPGPRLLRVERAASAAVASLVGAITAGTVVWWAAIASAAPWFIQGAPDGAPSSPWTLRLALTAGAMAVATALCLAGVARARTGRLREQRPAGR